MLLRDDRAHRFVYVPSVILLGLWPPLRASRRRVASRIVGGKS